MPDRDPLTGVSPSRHPFQIWVLAACVFAGIGSVEGFGRPATLQEVIPEYMVVVWGWSLLLGGLLGIGAAYWRDRVTGLLIERLALLAIGGSCVIYGGVVLYIAGLAALTIFSFCMGISIASVWRVRHVNRELKTLMRWIVQKEDRHA